MIDTSQADYDDNKAANRDEVHNLLHPGSFPTGCHFHVPACIKLKDVLLLSGLFSGTSLSALMDSSADEC